MKRFLAFGGDSYYPSGGWRDFEDDFDDLEQAIQSVIHEDWFHVVDLETRTFVVEGRAGKITMRK